MPDPQQILEILRKIRYDATAIQAKLTEAMELVAMLPTDGVADYVCECGLRFNGPLSFAEHRYHAHDGPVPPHWEAAETLAEDK